MNDGGIISQFGFEYQKSVFIYCVLNEINVGKVFGFEYLDDVSFSSKELCCTSMNDNILVQCKTGNITLDTLIHVFANWLTGAEQKKYYLYSENNITCEYSYKTVIKEIYDGIKNYRITKRSNKNSIYYKLKIKYNHFSSIDNIKKFVKDFRYIFVNKEFVIIDNEKLLAESYAKYTERNSCDLTIEYAKKSRFYSFSDSIILKIREAMLNKSKFVFNYNDYSKLVNYTIKTISDDKYEPIFFEFKNSQKGLYQHLIDSREGVLLQKIYSNEHLIAEYLINELYYKDLRDYYINVDKGNLINNIEDIAYINYLEETENNEELTKVFKNVINKNIDDKILVNKQYNKGCYIYLSSDDAIDGEFFIDWCGENVR